MSSTLPEVDGEPAFVPGPWVTLVVAGALAACVLLVAAVAGWIELPLPRQWVRWLAVAMAAAFAVRAVGEFRLVGFFKRVKGTRFARMDTRVYSPLCLLLALATAALLWLTRS